MSGSERYEGANFTLSLRNAWEHLPLPQRAKPPPPLALWSKEAWWSLIRITIILSSIASSGRSAWTSGYAEQGACITPSDLALHAPLRNYVCIPINLLSKVNIKATRLWCGASRPVYFEGGEDLPFFHPLAPPGGLRPQWPLRGNFLRKKFCLLN